MNRNTLHSLIDIVDEKEIGTVYRILLKFVAEDKATPDEVEAIKQARREIENGEVYNHDEVWS